MHTIRRFILLLTLVGVLALGVLIGGYLFSDTQPRSLIALRTCGDNCLKQKELLGLVGSIIVQKTPALLPDVLFETDKTIAIDYPVKHDGDHFVIIPKRDIRNIGDIREEDEPYIMDALAVVGKLVEDKNLGPSYRILTYGPGRQDIAYLHFHLLGPGAN